MSSSTGGQENEQPVCRNVQIDMGLRVTCTEKPGALAQILGLIRESGGDLYAHLIWRVDGLTTAFFLCERPAEAALALQEAGAVVETETVVTVRTDNRTGALSHIVQTLEADGVSIEYSYAWSRSSDVFMALRTLDNPKAEDLLRKYLLPADTVDPTSAV